MDLVDRLFAGRELRKRIADNRDRLFRVALAWCGDRMMADDLVQETLVISLQRVSQLRDKERLNAWMYIILSNCWKQHLRRMRPTVDIDEIGIVSGSDAESDCSEQEIVDRVRAAIVKLPVGQRQTLTLVDLAGFSYAEVADVLSIPMGTVMSRLYSARQSLQKTLVDIHASGPAHPAYLRRVK
jgi:RNA polymerase sigma-70 factor (ECF subfamily)